MKEEKKQKETKPKAKTSKKTAPKKETFSMHGLMMKHKISHQDRVLLGLEMSSAYFAVTGTKPPKVVKDPTPKKNGQPSFQVATYPNEWRPIAMNIIEQHLKKDKGGKV